MTTAPIVDFSGPVPILVLTAAFVALCWLLPALISARFMNGRLAGPDPQLQLALKAVRSGEWEPAAGLLAAAGDDWDRRAHYAGRLAYSAAYDGDVWLDAWHAARPDHPDAVLVSACTRVKRAWRLRGRLRANMTSSTQFAAFHQELVLAREDLAHAAAVHPNDPTPLANEMWVALGLSYSKDAMRSLWADVEARSPHHFSAHYAALQYFCEKWCGSRGEAEWFAARAAQQAPHGSLLTLLPLIAWFEHGDPMVAGASAYRAPELFPLVDAALEDVSAAGNHPNLPDARHLLAYILLQQRRYRAAMEQFRRVDGYTDALPWRYHSRPKLSYLTHRTRAMWGALLARR